MTLFTTDYLEYYLTLVGWVVHNGIWSVLVTSGVFAIPFIAINLQEWLKARGEGADEGNKGLLSAARIETRVWVAVVVVLFAGIPFIDVDLSRVRFDDARSRQCGVSVLQPSDTGWSQSFTTLNDQSAKVPVWWAFMHALSRGLTSASVAAIPCGTELRQIRMEIDATRIDDPVLAQEVSDFSHDCYGPARAKLFMNRPSLMRRRCMTSLGLAHGISWTRRGTTTVTAPALHAMRGRMKAIAMRVSPRYPVAVAIRPGGSGGAMGATGCGRACCPRSIPACCTDRIGVLYGQSGLARVNLGVRRIIK